MVRNLKVLCVYHKPQAVFLMEAKEKIKNLENLRRQLRYDNFFRVEAIGKSGGLGLMRQQEVSLKIYANSKNFIHTKCVWNSDRKRSWLMFIYVNPTFVERRMLWKDLKLSLSRTNFSMEKGGFRPPHWAQIEAFRKFLEDYNFRGCPFERKLFYLVKYFNGVRERHYQYFSRLEQINSIQVVSPSRKPLVIC